MKPTEIHYVSDADGNRIAVIVPIASWREIESERETAYLLRSETMKRHLLGAKQLSEGIVLGDAAAELRFSLPGLHE